MFTKKDREIANQGVKISGRDKVIKYQEGKIARLESIIRQIDVLANSNRYGNAEAYLRKIKEICNQKI